MDDHVKKISLQQLQVFEGTTFEKWWDASHDEVTGRDFDPGWFLATVTEVAEVDGCTLPQLNCRYDSGDHEDYNFTDVFFTSRFRNVKVPLRANTLLAELRQPGTRSASSQALPPQKNSPNLHKSSYPVRHRASMVRRSGPAVTATDEDEEEGHSDSGISGTDVAFDVNAMDETRPTRRLKKRSAPRSAGAGPVKRCKGSSGRSRLAHGSVAHGAEAETPQDSFPDDSPVSTDTVVHTAADEGPGESASQWQPIPSDEEAAADSDWTSAPSLAPASRSSRPKKPAVPRQEQWKNNYPGPVTDPDVSKGIGSAGQIACVKLQDFMCHPNLELPFSPNVVFISGTNGSGKSALLNAIQLCLGARATDTGRNTKFSDFIRTVTNGDDSPPTSALAIVTIWNTGTDAYHPHTFGNQISVVKRITATSAIVQLLDQDSRPVEQGKQALERVLEHVGVEAKNRAVCMSQDTCRMFAAEVEGRQKYEYYMDATQLLKTREDQIRSSGQIEATRECTKEAKTQLKKQRRELDSVRERLAVLQEVTPLRDLYDAVHNCMAWAHISEMRSEETARRKTAEVDLPNMLAKAVERTAEIDASLASIDEKRNPKVERLMALEPEIARLAKEQKDVQAALRQAARGTRTAGEEHRLQCVAADDAEADAANFNEECKAQEVDQSHLSQAANRLFDDGLKTARRNVTEAAVNRDTSAQQLAEALAAKDQAQECLIHARAVEADHGRQVQQHRATILSLDGRQGNPLLAFGGNGVLKLMQCIEEDVMNGGFHRPPLGPVGALLSLTDEKWAVAVEANCSKHLSSFLVHDMADLRRLKDICRSINFSVPTIVVTRFDHPLHNLAKKPQPPPDVLTMLKVLRVQEGPLQHVVSNFLIDMRLERAALVDGNSQATLDFMRGPRSRCVAATWNPAGDMAYNKGSSTTARPNNKHVVPRLSQDVSALLTAERSALRKAEAAKGAAAEACQSAKAREQDVRNAYSSAMRARNAAQRALADSQAAEDELVEKGPDLDGIGSPGDVDRIAAEKLGQALRLRREADQCKVNLQQAVAEEQRFRADLEQLQGQSSELKDTSDSIEEALTALTAARDQRLAEQDQWAQQKEALEKKCEEMAKKVEKLAEELESNVAMASQICSEGEGSECRTVVAKYLSGGGPAPLPPNTAATSADQAKRMVCNTADMQIQKDSTKARIDKCQSRVGGNLDDLEVQKEFLEELVGRKGMELQVVAANLTSANEGNIKRKQRYYQICKSTDGQLGNHFSLLCSRRTMVGSIGIDRERRSLSLTVDMEASQHDRPSSRPRAPASGSASRSAIKGLSGGERSVITLCFALALQNVVNAPFFCMDEFDVFMDPVNRLMGMRLLLEAAMDNPERQLILFSPQDTDAVTKAMAVCQNNHYSDMPAGFVKMIRLKPARGSATDAATEG